nr:DUF6483 family protein [Clostridium folliculivorans]
MKHFVRKLIYDKILSIIFNKIDGGVFMGFLRSKKDDEKQAKAMDNSDLNNIGSTDLLQLLLKRMVYEGEYNKAENLLFEELEKNKTKSIQDVGIKFYNMLLEKSDEDLIKNNFSREEVYQGLNDINSLNFD